MVSTKSSSGALLRALFCVGMGHVYLGRIATGWVLLVAMAALTWGYFVATAWEGATSPASLAFAALFQRPSQTNRP